MIKPLLALLTLTLLWGCASPPREELNLARKAVAQAYSSGAEDLAPEEYQAAINALKDGEYLFNTGKYSLAREILPRAASRAYRAKFMAWEEQDRLSEEQKLQEEALKAARLAPQRPPTPKPKPPPPSKPKPRPTPKPKPPPPPIRYYEVGDDENLWTIAGRKEIYVDPLLWPLIYRANRDQIKDPRRVYKGQVLTIPRQLSEHEIDEARKAARQSDIFPVDSPMNATGDQTN